METWMEGTWMGEECFTVTYIYSGKTGEAVRGVMKKHGWEKNEAFTHRLQIDATLPWLKANVQVFRKKGPKHKEHLSLFKGVT